MNDHGDLHAQEPKIVGNNQILEPPGTEPAVGGQVGHVRQVEQVGQIGHVEASGGKWGVGQVGQAGYVEQVGRVLLELSEDQARGKNRISMEAGFDLANSSHFANALCALFEHVPNSALLVYHDSSFVF